MVRAFRWGSVLVALFLGCATSLTVGLARRGIRPRRPVPVRARPSSPATTTATPFSNYQECQLGTSPVLDDDTDRDHLADPNELTYGSNPTNPNTDGDAIGDGCEVKWRTLHLLSLDPVVPDADSDGDGIPNAVES